MSDSTTSKKIKLVSNDGRLFELPETVAKQSKWIGRKIEEFGTENVIPLPNVTGPILEMVIEFCTKHVEAAERLRKWEQQFLSEKHTNMIFELCKAAEYLDIKELEVAADKNACDRMIATGDKTEEELGVTWKDKLSPDEKEEEE
ncbi:SKP1-like protein 10 [Carex littledalei]|uniref:SKP1-like protein n=1 Tax=Carex littledalei TaxID=544730 RepID=A0A833QRU9_9POAL|nr:SKP1-like protein 10 [Carex littledalei]